MKRQRKQKSVVTKTGDKGDTGLLYGGRVSKSHPRVEAYGWVDEAVSALGLAPSPGTKPKVREVVLKLQKELFTVGAELATDPKDYGKLKQHFKTVTPAMTEGLEEIVKQLEEEIDLPRTFLIPGATTGGAALDLARTIVRRAERRAVGLKEAGLLGNQEVIRYLNRLSDVVYELARYETKDLAEEIPITGRKDE